MPALVAGVGVVQDGESLRIRDGSVADTRLLVEMFDEAVAWLVERGQPGQWGERPWSSRPEALAFVDRLVGSGGLRIAELDGEPAGAVVVGERPAHVPPVEHPELYVNLLLVSRRHAGKKFGNRLVQVAIDAARAAGLDMLGVDCWAGAPTLVAWYLRQGFTPNGTFELNGWRGQIFEMSLTCGGHALSGPSDA
jgi:GNAT superfamily N-acetyltransferase